MISIKTILIDIDNVCAKTDEAMLSYYNEITGNNIRYNRELVTWNLEFLIKDWTKEQVNDMFNHKEFFKHMKLYDGVVETLNKLKTDGYYLKAVTCHSAKGMKYKHEWIKNNLSMLDEIFIIPLGEDLKLDKSSVEGLIIIDDVPEILNTSPCKYKILYGEYSWQNNCEKFTKAKNWEDIYTYIKIIEIFENKQ